MVSAAEHIYQDIAVRTGGDIYIGVVGPVRTGKSTFVKRFMETLVIPNIENAYSRDRARDELPQSGSGRTIMTSEPKFIPEDAVEISPDGTASLSVRLIDSVGYLIPGAMGADEDGIPRMVTTPWFPQEIPMADAAELGTKKIMDDHCTVGIVVTTDGTITDIPREDYKAAEGRAITDMKAANKPFLVLINSEQPQGSAARDLQQKLETEYQVRCLRVNCLTMDVNEVLQVLSALLYEFPLTEVHIHMPRWVEMLPCSNDMKSELFNAIRKSVEDIDTLSQSGDALQQLNELTSIDAMRVTNIDPATGTIVCELSFGEELFYQILSEQSGFELHDDGELLQLLQELSVVRKKYDKIASALEQVQATGYGVVMPTREEMELKEPQIIRKGNNYSVRLSANASSIHMIKADVDTEVCPVVGDEKQASDVMEYLLQDYDGNVETLWDSSIFGRTVSELVTDGIGSKLRKLPDASRQKLRTTLSRIINEESSGLLCIILA